MIKKCTNIYNVICSALIALSLVLSTQIVINGGVGGNKDENFVIGYGWKSFVLFVVLFIGIDILLTVVFDYLKMLLDKIKERQVYSDNRLVFIWTIINIVAWIPYYLSYYPGGVYSDTFASVSYYYSNIKTNRHPFLYNSIIGFFIKVSEMLGQDLTFAFGLFFLVQMMVMIAEFSFFNKWMQKHQINKKVINVIMFLAVFYPLIPLNVVSIWKDTPFCMSFLFWIMAFVDLIQVIRSDKVARKDIVLLMLGEIAVAFTRNNGIYVIIITSILLILITIKNKYKNKIITLAGVVSAVAIIMIVQGPVYNWIGVQQTDTVENFGIPLQQIGSVVAYDGNISQEQLEILDKFIPVENISGMYAPCLADSLKFYGGLNYEYLSNNKMEFLKLWAELLVQNPKLYINAYIMETVGFWNVDVRGADAYIQNSVWENVFGVVGTDYFEKIFGFSFQHYVNPRNYISNAWFFWAFLICAFFCARYWGWKKILYFIPQLSIWLTLMIATPIAWSLRYISALIFTLPFIIIVPILIVREKNPK